MKNQQYSAGGISPARLVLGGFVLTASLFSPPLAMAQTTIVDANFTTAAIHTGLTNDTNGFLTPTTSQAVWVPFGTGTITYVQGTGGNNGSIGVSSGSTRGLMAYFASSTAPVSLAVGDTLTVALTFRFNGSGAGANGDFRIGLLNSGGGATNIASASSRYAVATSNSLTSSSTARGYSGYIANTRAATTGSTDTLSFWERTPGVTGSQQIVGPTASDLAATTTFAQLGNYGGGSVGAVANSGTLYTLTFSASHASASQINLDYRVANATTDETIMSYSGSDSSTLITSFDSLMVFSTYNNQLTVTDMNVSVSSIPEPSTYAAFAGLAALGLVAYRRRRAAAPAN